MKWQSAVSREKILLMEAEALLVARGNASQEIFRILFACFLDKERQHLGSNSFRIFKYQSLHFFTSSRRSVY